MSRQLELDFPRGARLKMLDETRLADAPGVRELTLRSVLKSIESFGRGREAFPSQRKIATTVGCSVRQVKRAIAVLVSRSLLCVTYRRPTRSDGFEFGTAVNHYRIVWNELALLHPDHGAILAQYHGAMVSNHGAMVSNHGAMVSNHGAIGGPSRKPQEAQIKPPPTAKDEWAEAEAALNRLGVAEAGKAVSSARARGCTSGHVCSLVEEFQRLTGGRPGAWGVGALHYRVKIASPSLGVAEAWPPARETIASCQANSDRRDAAHEAQRRVSQSVALIREMRSQGVRDDAVIAAALNARGLEWP